MTEIKSKLAHFPISMFAITMGLSGLTIASHKMEWFFGSNSGVFIGLAYGTLIIYLAILATYTLKSLSYPQAVLADWNHPLKIAFFPAASISLLLLGAAFFPISQNLSFFLWATGTFFQFFLSMAIVNSWINHPRYEIVHSTPTWFIPLVGNIIVPIVGVEHAPVDVSWFFFAWGLLFWFILLTLIMNRLVFHNPLPDKLLPTIFIFLAPPSIGFISYIQLTGELDVFARLMYYWAGFFFLLVTCQINRFVRLQFSMAWWAYTFPLAAFCSATHIMGTFTGYTFFIHGARGLFVLCFVVVVALSVRTTLAMVRKELFVPD